MNIASPTAQPVPGKVDTPNALRGASAPAREGIDPATQADGTDAQGFGTILAQHLRTGFGADVPQDGNPISTVVDAGQLIGPDGLPIATTNPVSSARADDTDLVAVIDNVASAGTPTPTAATLSSKPKDDAEAPAAAGRREGDDAAVSDLAAQLALVSQWAAVAQPVVAQGAGVPTDAKADTLDMRGKLDTIRAGAAKVGAAKVDAATVGTAQVIDEPAAAVAPFVATTATDRNTRALPPTSGTAIRTADAKTRDDANLSTVGAPQAITEALLARVEAVTTHTQPNAASLANAFVTQVTGAASSAQSASLSPNLTTLSAEVGTPAWSHEVGQATLRLAASDLQGASLRLNPEHLGPLDVQVRVDNGVAHLSFTAAHVETRQAIESSRTTLDQMFSDQGLRIGDCAVGDWSSQRRFDAEADRQNGSQRDGGRRGSDAANDGDTQTTTVTTVRRALGLVDTFA